MNFQLICDNSKCPYKGNEPYHIDFAEEAVLDMRNVAAIFCPHCDHEMRSVQSLLESENKGGRIEAPKAESLESPTTRVSKAPVTA